jgi:hypothetical protein
VRVLGDAAARRAVDSPLRMPAVSPATPDHRQLLPRSSRGTPGVVSRGSMAPAPHLMIAMPSRDVRVAERVLAPRALDASCGLLLEAEELGRCPHHVLFSLAEYGNVGYPGMSGVPASALASGLEGGLDGLDCLHFVHSGDYLFGAGGVQRTYGVKFTHAKATVLFEYACGIPSTLIAWDGCP